MSRAIIERDFSGPVTLPGHFRTRAILAGSTLLPLTLYGISQDGARTFNTVTGLALFATLILVPPGFASLVSRERASHALEVLLATPLGSGRIVLSAWGARFLLTLLLALTTLPSIAAALTLGGVTVAQFFAFLLYFLITLVWSSALALFAGSLVREPALASRLAYAMLAFAFLVPPLLAPSTGPGSEFSPLGCLRLIQSQGSGELIHPALLRHGAVTLGIGALALFATTLIFRSAARGHRSGWRRRRGDKVFVPFRGVMQRSPLFWLALRRGLRFRGAAPTLLAALGIVIAESLFVDALDLAWESGRLVAAHAPQTHLLVCVAYLVTGLLVAATDAAHAQRKEDGRETLQVLYASPVRNRDILRGLYLSSSLSAIPFVLLASLHAALAAYLGAIEALVAVAFTINAFLCVAAVTAETFLGSLRRKSPLKALSGILVASPMRSGVIGALALVLFCSPASMIVWGLWPPLLMVQPFLLARDLHFVLAATLLNLVAYGVALRRLVGSEIPMAMVSTIDPRHSALAKIKKRRRARIGLRHGGQQRKPR